MSAAIEEGPARAVAATIGKDRLPAPFARLAGAVLGAAGLGVTALAPTTALALAEADGGSFRQGELDGYIGTSGGCSSLLLTNSWVLTAAHCYKSGSTTYMMRFAVPDREDARNRIAVDPSASFAHPSLDVRVMKLEEPVAVNGMTEGFVTRILNETAIPASLVKTDLTENGGLSELVTGPRDVFIELGAGGNEDGGSPTKLRSCRESSYRGAFSGWVKFDHDMYGGQFPLLDFNNIGCEYLGGDSGSPTLYRDQDTGEWRVVATCPGRGEGYCIAASGWEDFATSRVWGGRMPPGLAIEEPRVAKGAAVTVHYEDEGLASRAGRITVEPVTCADAGGCDALLTHDIGQGAAAGSVDLATGRLDPGRYQVRYHSVDSSGNADLLRVIGLHVGGAIRLRDTEYRKGNIARLELHGLEKGRKYELLLIDRGHGLTQSLKRDGMTALSRAAFDAIKRQSVGYEVTGGKFQTIDWPDPVLPFSMGLGHAHITAGMELDILLVEAGSRRLADVSSILMLNKPVWAPIPDGFNIREGLRFVVDGEIMPREPVEVTLASRTDGKRAAFPGVLPINSRIPAYYHVPATALREKGIGVSDWMMSVRRTDQRAVDISGTDADVPLTQRRTWDGESSTTATSAHIRSTDIDASFEHRTALPAFGSLTVDLETTHPTAGPKSGIVFSVWTGMPGTFLTEKVCRLSTGTVKSCDRPVDLDRAPHFGNDRSRCLHLRAQYVDDVTSNRSDPEGRISEVGSRPEVIGESWLCGGGRSAPGWH